MCVSSAEMLRKLQSRTWRELRLLPEALVLLGLMRLAVLLVPFQRTAGFLGLTQKNGILPDVPSHQLSVAGTIGWAVRAMAARTPWESACLTQALAGMIMLQRRGIPAALYLGVAKDADDPKNMAAHAWLTCGDTMVTGESGYERFTVISTFLSRKSR